MLDIRPLRGDDDYGAALKAIEAYCPLRPSGGRGRNHNYASALGACNQTVELGPKHAGAVAIRGFTHLGAGETSGAEADFDAALALDRNNAVALYGRSIIRRRNGDSAGADTDLAAAKTYSPGW